MACRTRRRRLWPRGASACAVLLASTALALAEPSVRPAQPAPPPSPDDYAADPTQPPTPLSPEVQEALRELLNFDAPSATSKQASPLRTNAAKTPSYDFNWNRTDKNDGTAALTVKKPLPNGFNSWNADVGADFGLNSTAGSAYQPDKAVSLRTQDSGTAWANVAVPGFASINARVDPTKDQSKVGTTLSHSVPFGRDYSITLQNTYAVTETLGPPTAPATGFATTPGAAGSAPGQVWSTDRLVKFNILSTGTSFGAGTTSATGDSITHHKFSAEQKLFENFNVTTSVTDMGTAAVNRSITAGFKLKW